jgi:hypothetical protein
MRSNGATQGHLHSAASPSILQVHWTDDMSLIASHPLDHQTRAGLPPLASSAMAPRLERPLARHHRIFNRAGVPECHYLLHLQDLRRAIQGHKVWGLAMMRIARPATLQHHRRADLGRPLLDPFPQHRWDGRMSQLKPQHHRHRHRHHYQDLQQLMVFTSIPAHGPVAMASTLHHLQKRKASRRYLGLL